MRSMDEIKKKRKKLSLFINVVVGMLICINLFWGGINWFEARNIFGGPGGFMGDMFRLIGTFAIIVFTGNLYCRF